MIFSKSITQYDVFLLVQERGHKQGIKISFSRKSQIFGGKYRNNLISRCGKMPFSREKRKIRFFKGKKKNTFGEK